MKISVAICTWNRARLLDQTLTHMQTLKIPADVTWELIVADNNCTDETGAVIDRYRERLPIKKLSVRQQGQSHCRNAAIEAATGHWILWTDDDVVVAPDWLQMYCDAIRAHPEFVFAGGTIEPWFATTPPGWLNRHLVRLEGAFAILRRDSGTRPLRDDEWLFGANMAIRTDVSRENLFDTTRGLIGNNSVRGDETEMFDRLQKKGHRGLWIGRAKVQHFIPEKRMTTRYLRDFYQGYGRAITQQTDSSSVPTFFGRPRWAIRGYAIAKALACLSTFVKNEFWLRHFRHAATCAGILAESASIARKRT